MQFKLLARRILYKLFTLVPFKQLDPAKVNIDVVIMAIRKDLVILPLCIEGIRNSVQHPISAIYIVSPEDPEIQDFCKRSGTVFVNESTLLGYTPKDMNIVTGKHKTNRSGWLFQQLLKLSGRIGENRYYLCIDADHILLQPHTFLTSDSRFVFYQSSELHVPYYRNIHQLMKGQVSTSSMLSYVSHKMIFDKELLQGLRDKISKLHQKDWDKAIIDNLDLNEDAGFSEFELYGNYVQNNLKRQRPWRQALLNYNQLLSYQQLKETYGAHYSSATFPKWLSDSTIKS